VAVKDLKANSSPNIKKGSIDLRIGGERRENARTIPVGMLGMEV
jgi:hypothetical protein